MLNKTSVWRRGGAQYIKMSGKGLIFIIPPKSAYEVGCILDAPAPTSLPKKCFSAPFCHPSYNLGSYIFGVAKFKHFSRINLSFVTFVSTKTYLI
jgi:hypothetical protein